jgi:hypothetical protein
MLLATTMKMPIIPAATKASQDLAPVSLAITYAPVPTKAATHLYATQDSVGGDVSKNIAGIRAAEMHIPVKTMNVSVSVNRRRFALSSPCANAVILVG